MRYLIILLLFVSCGTKNKVQVGGTVGIPTEFEVKHKFSYDVTAIEDACEERFKDETDPATKEDNIDECIQKKELMMEQLFHALTNPKAPIK